MPAKKQRKRRRICRPHVERLELRIAPLNIFGIGVGAGLVAELALLSDDPFAEDWIAPASQATPTTRPVQMNAALGISNELPAGSQFLSQNDRSVEPTRVLEPEIPISSGHGGANAVKPFDSVAAEMVDQILEHNPAPQQNLASDSAAEFFSTFGMTFGGSTTISDAIYQLAGVGGRGEHDLEHSFGDWGLPSLPGSIPDFAVSDGVAIRGDDIEIKERARPEIEPPDSPDQVIRLSGPETEIIVPHQRQQPSESNSFEGEFVVELDPGVSSEMLAPRFGYSHEFAYPNLNRNLNVWKIANWQIADTPSELTPVRPGPTPKLMEVALERNKLTPELTDLTPELTRLTPENTELTPQRMEPTLGRQGLTPVPPGLTLERPGLPPARIDLPHGPELTPELRAKILQSNPRIVDAYPVYPPKLTTTSFASDPLFPAQWHLMNTGQTGGVAGLDANVPAAWDLGVTGRGVTISIVDSGTQTTHPDLSPHVDALASYDFFSGDNDPSPTIGDGICQSAGGTAECHGTAVAGVAAGVGNSIGVSGAAPNATIGASRLITGGGLFASQIADALDWDTTKGTGGSEYDGTRIDISNNSWGSTTDYVASTEAAVIQNAIIDSANSGRGGLGKIFVFSAGNGRTNKADVNYQSGLHNSRQVIAVAAAAHDGTISEYSNPGASLLIAAPSNGQGEGISTTDLVTTNISSSSRSDTPGYTRSDYTNDFGGTSSAAPLVSGVLALVLEANPNLSWRDVQHIVANSASTSGLTATSLSSFAANQSGRMFSHDFGFGIINAAGAVNLATNWRPVGPEVMVSASAAPSVAIPDAGGGEVTSTINISPNIQVETVEVVLDATHTFRGDLRVTLEHAGTITTTSKLAEPRNDDGDHYSDYVFTSRAHWGETSSGNWTLKIQDEFGGDVGTFNDWTLRIHGTEIGEVHGPRVVQSEISSNQLLEGQISTFQVQFDQPIDTGTFSSADIEVTRIEGSTTTNLSVGAPAVVAGTNNTVFDVSLSTAQTAAANYRFTIGPDINGTNGLQMDQNADSSDGNTAHTQFFQMGSRLMFSATTPAGFSGTLLSEGAFFSNAQISVPSRTLTNLNVDDLNLRFDLFHAVPSRDLRLRLDSPHRTFDIVSMENSSNSTGDSTAGQTSFTNGYWDTVLDDESPNGFIDATVNPNAYHFSDSYRPGSGTPLSLFDGSDSDGTWTLWVRDGNVDGHQPVLNDYTLIITPALTTPNVQIDSVTNFDGDNLIDVTYTISDDAVASSLTLGVFESDNGFFDWDSDTSTGTFEVTSINCVATTNCLSIGQNVVKLNASLFPTPTFTRNSPLYGVVVADPDYSILDPDRSNNVGLLTGVTKASGNALWVAGDPHARNTATITNSDVTFTNLNSGNAIGYTSDNVDFIFANMGMLDDSVTASAVSNFNILAILAEGSDTYTGGSLIDVVQGGAGHDNLSGNAGNDRLFGGAGVDILSGGSGDNLLSVGPGSGQTIDVGGGGGNAIVVGGTAFNDHVTVWDPDGNSGAIGSTLMVTVVNPVNPTGFAATSIQSVTFTNVSSTDRLLIGTGPGDDRIQLQQETPNFDGNVGSLGSTIVGINAIIGGGAGSDTIYAGLGSDQIFGDQYRNAKVGAGDGNDTIDARDGTGGNDILWGAGGTNTLLSDDGDTKNDG